MKRILVTGAMGQIGSELVPELRRRFGADSVVASDLRMEGSDFTGDGPHEYLDCTDQNQVNNVIKHWNIDAVYHMAALLSAVCEQSPQRAWKINMDGLYNVLEASRQFDCAVFFPSSIGAFGPETPKYDTPQITVQRPTSMYGVTKVSGEMLCAYYRERFAVDVRGLRLPGLISPNALPGGGTTDYAVHIFHAAVEHERYRCFLGPDTRLDMMYMPDAVRAIIELMSAPAHGLSNANAYNISAINFTPAELADAIRQRQPEFEIRYDIDPVRQAIADSWPMQVNGDAAATEWGWQHEYDVDAMVVDMLDRLSRPQAVKEPLPV